MHKANPYNLYYKARALHVLLNGVSVQHHILIYRHCLRNTALDKNCTYSKWNPGKKKIAFSICLYKIGYITGPKSSTGAAIKRSRIS